MRANTSSQSPKRVWRNNRMVGYQGLSSRRIRKRQSAPMPRATHTGTAKPPAKCAIEVLHDRRRIHEGPGRFIQAAAQVHNVKLLHHAVQLLTALAFLETKEANAGQASQGGEVLEWDGTHAIAWKAWIALPGNADLEAGSTFQLTPPLFD